MPSLQVGSALPAAIALALFSLFIGHKLIKGKRDDTKRHANHTQDSESWKPSKGKANLVPGKLATSILGTNTATCPDGAMEKAMKALFWDEAKGAPTEPPEEVKACNKQCEEKSKAIMEAEAEKLKQFKDSDFSQKHLEFLQNFKMKVCPAAGCAFECTLSMVKDKKPECASEEEFNAFLCKDDHTDQAAEGMSGIGIIRALAKVDISASLEGEAKKKSQDTNKQLNTWLKALPKCVASFCDTKKEGSEDSKSKAVSLSGLSAHAFLLILPVLAAM